MHRSARLALVQAIAGVEVDWVIEFILQAFGSCAYDTGAKGNNVVLREL
jgi:hypothetical protein